MWIWKLIKRGQAVWLDLLRTDLHTYVAWQGLILWYVKLKNPSMSCWPSIINANIITWRLSISWNVLKMKASELVTCWDLLRNWDRSSRWITNCTAWLCLGILFFKLVTVNPWLMVKISAYKTHCHIDIMFGNTRTTPSVVIPCIITGPVPILRDPSPSFVIMASQASIISSYIHCNAKTSRALPDARIDFSSRAVSRWMWNFYFLTNKVLAVVIKHPLPMLCYNGIR